MTSKREIVELGQILQRKNVRLGDAAEPPILTCTENHGLVDQIKHMGKRLATEDASKYKVVDPGDIVYNVYLLWLGSIGQNVTGSRGITSPVYEVFTPSDSVCGPYIGLLLRSSWMVERYSAIAIGTVPRRRRTPWQDFLKLTVALPPLPEQRRIVDLIGALDDAIEAANEKLAALVLVAGNQRDAMYDSPIKLIELESICSSDGSLVSPLAPEYANMPHIGIDRIESGTGDLLSAQSAAEDGVTSGKFKFDSSHVIYSKIRPELQKVALPEFDGICSADAYPLLPIEGVPRIYLQQLLLSSGFTRKVVSKSGRTKMPKINKKELLSILVPQHGTQEMLNFSELATAIAVARHKAATQLDSLRALRTELLTSLLSGAHEIPESYDEVMNAV